MLSSFSKQTSIQYRHLNVLQAVSLDGTYYHKGGIVSSGKASLQQKAKRWLGQEILEAQNRKVRKVGFRGSHGGEYDDGRLLSCSAT